ncbi:hypothetical protein KAX75_10265, partial [candidate division WOR-3 bacterium]|nr:hypothetical protein [candidate division WOR-3 bacterium]
LLSFAGVYPEPVEGLRTRACDYLQKHQTQSKLCYSKTKKSAMTPSLHSIIHPHLFPLPSKRNYEQLFTLSPSISLRAGLVLSR